MIATAVAALGLTIVPAAPAQAAATITVTRTTWDVVGLDSNRPVKSMPHLFPVGAKVCNTGDASSNSLVTNWVSITTSTRITPPSSLQKSIGVLAPGACKQVFYTIDVEQSSQSFGQSVQYRIDVVDGATTVASTPSNRALYVEKLLSQNRNSIVSLVGKNASGATVCATGTADTDCDLLLNQSYKFTLTAKSAPGGYEQTEAFINFPTYVDITKVTTTYSAPAGTTTDTVYADACGWDNDITSPTVRTCIGPVNYPGGKAGGDPIRTTYTVKPSVTGTTTANGSQGNGLTALIVDNSGGSAHYNADASTKAMTVSSSLAADLSIASAPHDAFIRPSSGSGTGTYTLTPTNNGPSTSSGTTSVLVTLPLASGVTFPSSGFASGTGWTCARDATTPDSKLTCTSTAGVASGSNFDPITVTTTIPSTAATHYDLTATVTGGLGDPLSTNNTVVDPTTTALITEADLQLSMSGSGTFAPGSSASYALTVKNGGPSEILNGTTMTLTDTLPNGMTYSGFSGTGWSCSASGQLVTCTNSDGLSTGGSSVLSIEVAVDAAAGGTLINTASVAVPSPDDPYSGNNIDITSATSIGSADLEISKSHTGSFVIPSTGSSTGTFTIAVTNAGPNSAWASASDPITVTDTLPSGLTYNSATGTGWSCSNAGQTVTCTRTTPMTNGESSSISLVANITAGQSEGALTNTATVSSTTSDPDTEDNAADDAVATVKQQDISVTKTATTSVTAGNDITYTIVTKNENSSATEVTATNVFWTDILPAGVTYSSVTPGGSLVAADVCSDSGQEVICVLGSLAPGASVTSTIVATTTVNTSTPVTNSVQVFMDQSDSNAANDSSSASTTVTGGNVAPSVSFSSPTTAVNEHGTTQVTYNWNATDATALSNPVASCGLNGAKVSGSETNSGLTTTSASGSFKCVFDDGAATSEVRVQIEDTHATVGSAAVTVSVANVAPSGTLTAPASAGKGTTFNISLAGTDVSAADTTALTYDFDCGSGYSGTFSATSSTTCTAPSSGTSVTVKGKVSDGDGGVTERTAAVTVTNTAPTAAPRSVTTAEDTAASINLEGQDTNSDPTSFTIVDAPDSGSLTGAGGTPTCSGTTTKTCTLGVTYTPDSNFNGSDSFTYKARDGSSDSAVVTVSITISAVNDAPTAAPASTNTTKNVARTVTLRGADIDDNATTFAIASGPTAAQGTLGSIGTITCASASGRKTCTAAVTYTPTTGFSGTATFGYRANDGATDSTIATVTITVDNDPPTAAVRNASTLEDTPATIDLEGQDTNGDATSFSIVAAPSSGTLSGAGAAPACSGSSTRTCTVSVVYTPTGSFNGSDSFTYKVNDGSIDSTVVTVSITVTAGGGGRPPATPSPTPTATPTPTPTIPPAPAPTATPSPTPTKDPPPEPRRRDPGPLAKLAIPDDNPPADSIAVWGTRLKRCKWNAGTFMELHRSVNGGPLKKVGRTRLDGNCMGRFKVHMDFKKAEFRAVWPKQNTHYRKGHSLDHVIVPRRR